MPRWWDEMLFEGLVASGLRHLRRGDAVKARRDWQAAATRAHLTSQVVRLSLLHLQAGDPASAADLLAALRDTDVTLLQLRVVMELARGDTGAAERLAADGLALVPPDGFAATWFHVVLAKLALDRGRPGTALLEIDRIELAEPDDTDIEARILLLDAGSTIARALSAAGYHDMAADMADDMIAEAERIAAGPGEFPQLPGVSTTPADLLLDTLLTGARIRYRADDTAGAIRLLDRVDAVLAESGGADRGLIGQAAHLQTMIAAADPSIDLDRLREMIDLPVPGERAYGWSLAGSNEAQHWAQEQNALARREYRAGLTGEALARAGRALPVARRAFGVDHPMVAEVLAVIAGTAAARGELDIALDAVRLAGDIEYRQIAGHATLHDSEQLRVAVDRHFRRYSLFLAVCVAACEAGSADAADVLFQTVLQRQGLELDVLRRARRNRPAGPLADELREVTREISALSVGGAERPREEYTALLSRKWLLEMRMGAEAGPVTAPATADLLAALPPGTALLQVQVWVRADLSTGEAGSGNGVEYLGLLAVDNTVRVLRFGPHGDVDRLVTRFRAAVAAGRADPHVAGDLGHRLAEPLRTACAGAAALLVAPDGALGLIPWDVLPDAAGIPLGERMRVSYLTSARVLLREAAPGPAGEPLVVAGPDFHPADHPVEHPPGWRSLSAQFPQGFPELPGAAREGEEVARILGTHAWTGPEATRDRVLQARSPRILHLATHGFYLDENDADLRRSVFARITGDAHRSTDSRLMWMTAPMPMLRCGLALAGADDPRSPNDGVVTGEDLAGLDLDATELAVLSACDTGLGDIRVQEGVTGLVYALSIAGARAVVVSLWRVDDEVGRRLMTGFYERFVASGDAAVSLHEARHAIAADDPDPARWSSFVLYDHVPR
ncbi:CHAT domain-containing protein [Actinoplanes subglobosus]|uniref:CHAT domain-containing protein n=1 Tax=Actinoplanes subglobosus TaxID=1547892 RepID=A0ABV8IQT7_9ACTN